MPAIWEKSWLPIARPGDAPALAVDQLDRDYAPEGTDRGERGGQQGVGGLATQDRDPDHEAQSDEAQAMCPAGVHGRMLVAGRQPEEEQQGEEDRVDS